MDNFAPKHRGKISGLINGCFMAGSSIFAGLYGLLYATGHVTDEANQNLSGFYLMTSITFAVTGILLYIILKTISI